MGYDIYLYTDEPIPYKGLLFYPIRVRDFMTFSWCVQSLIMDKNAIPDIKVISMSYLEFLFYLAGNGNPLPLQELLILFSLVLKVDAEEIKFYKRNDVPHFSIKDVEYGSNDFLEIKKIILLQNDVKDIDVTIQKELRDEFAEAEKLKQKLSGEKPSTFEEDIVSLMVALPGLTLNDIYEMPIRKFNRALKRADHKLHYEIYLAASMSGFVEFKNKDVLKHWTAGLEEGQSDRYKNVTMGLEELRSKVTTEK